MHRIFAFLLLVALQPSFGQTSKIFVEAGMIRANFTGGTAAANPVGHTSADPITTGFGGVGMQTDLHGSYRLLASLRVGAKGAHLISTDYSNSDERDVFINYISLPFSAACKILATKQGGLWAAIGLYGALAISGNEKGTYILRNNPRGIVYNNITIRSSNPDQVSPTNVRPFDWGLQVSLFYEIASFRLGLGYNAGLSGVLTNPALYDRQYYNRNIDASIAYQLFGLQRKYAIK